MREKFVRMKKNQFTSMPRWAEPPSTGEVPRHRKEKRGKNKCHNCKARPLILNSERESPPDKGKRPVGGKGRKVHRPRPPHRKKKKVFYKLEGGISSFSTGGIDPGEEQRR